MSAEVVLNVMLELFIIMIIGYVAAKLKFLDKNSETKLSWIVVNLSLPMLVISSVLGKEGKLTDVMDYLLYGTVFYLACIPFAYICCKLLFVKKKNMGTYQFMLIFSNCSFMGYPVMEAVLGKESIFYMSIFNMPFNVMAFSYGIFLLSRGGENSVKFNPKKLINPGIIASIFAVIIYATGINLPKFLGDACTSLGSITTPLSMIVLGVSLAHVPVRDLLIEFRLYPIALIRLIALPFITYAVVRLFTEDPMMIGVSVGTAAMPVASMCVMLSNLYGGNVKLASLGVFITTAASTVTIPMVLTFLL